MTEVNIREKIMNVLEQKPILKDIGSDQDFFDVGASSLTIVDMQMQLEEMLNLSVPTSKLMSNPTVDGWVSTYADAS
ncbi:acyl carrier protein [Aliikangiella sp. IMCC44359]|uniref:acyl carrier protein n=1 Tax=Aliikangiella sp. IMCC44359 TaxID=3459125 RepID=UPI00403AE015